jgi:hypothetical protein
MIPILDATLDRLSSLIDISKFRIQDMILGPLSADCPFNIVRLNNGAVGASLNYYEFVNPTDRTDVETMLFKKLGNDPLLLKHLLKSDLPYLLTLSLKTAILSALSRDHICSNPNIECKTRMDTSFFSQVKSATIIGYGGYLRMLINHPAIRYIHISDLIFKNDRAGNDVIDSEIANFRNTFPDKTITVSNGDDNDERIGSSDLVSITGSALCNGTMDELLSFANNCKYTIVQGQSAAIFPEVLFERGVSLVATALKPNNLLQIANNDPSLCHKLLEGALPYTFLYPRRS